MEAILLIVGVTLFYFLFYIFINEFILPTLFPSLNKHERYTEFKRTQYEIEPIYVEDKQDDY